MGAIPSSGPGGSILLGGNLELPSKQKETLASETFPWDLHQHNWRAVNPWRLRSPQC
ncbi:MAG: hypothetical protein HC890_04100 [Chloroflexaceae bacterium]|nr:hypothetical protein [Chloroflexaceae bacterium]